MAFVRSNFSGGVGHGSGAPKLYTYRTADDAKAAVIADDYFVDLVGVVEVGDVIVAHATDATVLLTVTKSDSDEVDTGYVAVA